MIERYQEQIDHLFGTVYSILQGKKVPRSEVIQTTKLLYPLTLKDYIAIPEHNEIVKRVVDRYAIEVGIQTYDPEFIDVEKNAKYWLFQQKNKIVHAYFDRYKLYLANEGFERKVIDNIEKSCEQILARCANPKTTAEAEKKKGLVVGDVQSGKTANYLGLINMAYDYGYRIVVLLAGVTNSLRTQTQKRMDSGVIGAVSDSIGNSIEFIGVGFKPKEHFAVPFTNRTHDFKKFVQQNLNIAFADIKKPVVLVVKKVKGILESVADRLQSELSEKGLDTKNILIIDDEADYASVNTAKNPQTPTTINKLIRDIFNKFPIASYVGFTATPFANIFIDPFDDESYMDLFPSDFIAQLHAPGTYFGGRTVFPKGGTYSKYVRLLDENEKDFLPVIHDRYVDYPALPKSLIEAINTFLICNVVRTIRGQETKHRSMMINITRFNDTQALIWNKVNEYIERLKNAIEQLSDMPVSSFRENSYCNSLYSLYMTDPFFEEISAGVSDDSNKPISWEMIQKGLYAEIKKFIIVIINSRNGQMNNVDPAGKKKRFDYDDLKDEGARVIAIGGMVLSRGLTLEGLMTSYYSRNAEAYDTLLQMCRWFGYRPKYKDLCRIYLTQISIDQFDAVLDATEDLKEQFHEMNLRDKKPIDFGLMVKECPDTLETSLLITSPKKMKGTMVFERSLNYSGVYADTSKLLQNAQINRVNTAAVEHLMEKVAFKETSGNGDDNHPYYMAQGVSQHHIAQLFKEISIPIENKKFNTDGIAEYTEDSDNFPVWDVVIATGTSNSGMRFHDLHPVVRSFHMKGENDFLRIGKGNNRVLDPGLFNAGLWIKTNETLSAKAYLEKRTTPILVIFPIDLKIEDNDEAWKIKAKESLQGEPLMAFAYGFPGTKGKVMVKYRANAVKINQLTRGIELGDEDEGEEDEDE